MDIRKMSSPISEQELQPYYEAWETIFDRHEAESAKLQLMGSEIGSNNITLYSMWDGDTLLGTVHITCPASVPYLSTVGCVCTTQAGRGMGISRKLLTQVLKDFDDNGGVVSYLATDNPIAENLYQSFGYYRISCTAVMRRFTNTNIVKFDEDFYKKSDCKILKNSPELRTLIVPLASRESPCFLMDINTCLFNPMQISLKRCESLYPIYKDLVDGNGAYFSAHNQQGALCALASCLNERIDVFYHQSYKDEAKLLICEAEKCCTHPYAVIASVDTEKALLFESLGYHKSSAEEYIEFEGFSVKVSKYIKENV